MVKISPYHNSPVKRLLDMGLSVLGLIILFPVFLAISVLVYITSGGPIYFMQKRLGKNGKIFKIIKFRTMIKNASKMQEKYKNLNESDGPVFKIIKDPRFVGIGYKLSRTGLDELPQLINVIFGDMSIVGPRPLPLAEAGKLTKSQRVRGLIKPGITSSWVVNGSHNLTFRKWMQLDREYVLNANFMEDLIIILKTIAIIFH